SCSCLFIIWCTQISTLFPYTTLFRSVYRLIEPDLTVEKVQVEDPAVEIERLNEAIEKSNAEIERIRAIAAQSLGEEEAQVFDAQDRKSTRLNSSHVSISYAVFCLKKK